MTRAAPRSWVTPEDGFPDPEPTRESDDRDAHFEAVWRGGPPATLPWWDDQPPEIAAVIGLANLDDGGRMAALFLPNHLDVLADIAEKLALIERCGHDDPWAVLADHHGHRVAGATVDDCERLAAQLRADVVLSAQLLASLVQQTAGAR